MTATYGSLFSGGGGFDLGFCRAGWRPAWFCEIDPTARAVLARHWPEVPCYEDIRQLDGRALSRVDCIVAGFPCQDVSVAGNRAGLAGERTGLFWELARVIGECGPTWLVLENVPGLLSSNGTEDMGAVLWALGELGYGWAYRVLDAQHWGVPQRRRRVFIVGHSGADTQRAAQVLFESEGRGGNSPAGGEAGEGAARGATAGAGESGGVLVGSLTPGAHPGGFNGQDAYTGHLIADTVRSHPRPGSNSVGNLAFHPTQDPISGPVSPALGHDGMAVMGIANTVSASAGHHGHSSPRGDGGDNLVVAACALAETLSVGANQTTGFVGDGVAHDAPRVAKSITSRCERQNAGDETLIASYTHNVTVTDDDLLISPTLPAYPSGPGGQDWRLHAAVHEGSTVRRLLPVETERLQGWPDGWTEGHPDGARYRLVGNGVASPVAEWIARRISRASAAGGGDSARPADMGATL